MSVGRGTKRRGAAGAPHPAIHDRRPHAGAVPCSDRL